LQPFPLHTAIHPAADESKKTESNQETHMLKFIALLTGSCLTLAMAAQAAEQPEANAKVKAQKPKAAPKQQVVRQPRTMPNTHAQTLHTQHTNTAVHNTVNPSISKTSRHITPNQTRTSVQSNKIQTSKQSRVQTQQHPVTNVQPNNAVTNTKLHNNTAVNKRAPLSQDAVARIRQQHSNFHAQPNTAIASARFNPNYRIQAARNWNGANYNAFRTYRPQRHDRGYWSSHYNNLSLIGGGWYYWNTGYWYPAWGYDDSASYYPYDGPIYSGPSARPFDQVVADVQAALQEQGLYKGEVDGLLGPLTRQALAEYQNSQGLYATETIDQPTLESLGLS
jgi:hypothetical protein